MMMPRLTEAASGRPATPTPKVPAADALLYVRLVARKNASESSFRAPAPVVWKRLSRTFAIATWEWGPSERVTPGRPELSWPAGRYVTTKVIAEADGFVTQTSVG